MKLTPLFASVRQLEAEIDLYLDHVLEAGLVFSKAVEAYVRRGVDREFGRYIEEITGVEEEGDRLRREIETKMTFHTLIPELREDVLSLIEQVDQVTNRYEESVYAFYVQRPALGPVGEGILELAEAAVATAEEMVKAARAFFKDLNAVRDHVKKVQFFESEADRVATRIGRELFESDLELAQKLHLQQFIDRIDDIADTSEDICDELSILVIKRLV